MKLIRMILDGYKRWKRRRAKLADLKKRDPFIYR
jgi:hypothetical protein